MWNPNPARRPSEGPFTWEDFVALPDDDRRELIDGFFEETEVPNQIHEHIVAMIIMRLMNWTLTRRAGRVLASGYKVQVSAKRGVMPDVQFFAKGNPGHPIALEQGRPDLAVEIVSPGRGRYDRVQKLTWYQSIGVPEYWIIDPDERSLQRFVLVEGDWRFKSFADDDVFRPETFPGLEISLAELWTFPDETPEPETSEPPKDPES